MSHHRQCRGWPWRWKSRKHPQFLAGTEQAIGCPAIHWKKQRLSHRKDAMRISQGIFQQPCSGCPMAKQTDWCWCTCEWLCTRWTDLTVELFVGISHLHWSWTWNCLISLCHTLWIMSHAFFIFLCLISCWLFWSDWFQLLFKWIYFLIIFFLSCPLSA